MEFVDVFSCIIAILTGLVVVGFAGAALVDSISDALSKRKSKDKKYYDKLKRVLQKSIREIGKKETLSNLIIAIHCTEGLENLRKELDENSAKSKKIFELECENLRQQAKIDTLNELISKKAKLDEKQTTKTRGKK